MPTELPPPSKEVKPYVFDTVPSPHNIRMAMLKKLDSLMRRHRDMKRGLGFPYDKEPQPCFFLSRPVMMELWNDHQTRVMGDVELKADGVWYFKGFPIFIVDTSYAMIECHENQSEILYA